MTLSAFTPTNAGEPAPTNNRLSPSDSVASNFGRVFRGAAAAVGKAIIILVAYRAALKRLGVRERNLFDHPVLWAELKSVVWAEAVTAAECWKDSFPVVGASAIGFGFAVAITAAGHWRL